MTSRFLRCLALASMAALHLHCHAAPAPAPLLTDYTHSAWGALQGAPVDVLKFAQGKDGWLWIATATGLFRYDGARFERTGSVYGHALPSSNVLGLAVTGDGAVWVGYRLGGVSVFRKGGTRTYTEADGLPAGAVFHIEAAPDGAMWVGTRDGAARLAPGADRFEPMGANVGLPTRRVYQILFARDGTQWMGTMYGAYFRRPGESRFSHAWPRTMLTSMDEGPDGSIWAVDGEDNYYRVRTSAPAPGELVKPDEKGVSMRFGRDGGMWLLQRDGVERKLQPSGPSVPAQRLTRQNGISGPLPQSTFQDREGNLWIGTSTGLDRLRPNRLKILQVEGQFDHPGLLPGPDGDVWIGDYAGDVRSFTAEGLKKVELKAMLSASHWAPDGVLWLGNEKGLHRRAPDGSMTQLAPPDGVAGLDPQALQQDRSGALWASFSGGGLFKRAGGQWIREGGLRGFPRELTTAMAMDGQGTLWFGHARNSISLVAERQQDGAVRRLGAEQGLQLGTVLQLYRDGELMWAGGEEGVALFRAGRFAALRGERGETFRGVSGIVRLPGGDLWLHGADGLFHVTAASVAAWLNQPDQAVSFERFDALDGLQGHAAQLRPVPSLIYGPDGLLWLSTSGAVATLDPAHIRRNPLPPPVQVHALLADGVRYATEGSGPVRLPQGSKSLQIAFTALSLSMPERVRFRYRLAGVDDGWQEPVGRREAYYTNLEPGRRRAGDPYSAGVYANAVVQAAAGAGRRPAAVWRLCAAHPQPDAAHEGALAGAAGGTFAHRQVAARHAAPERAGPDHVLPRPCPPAAARHARARTAGPDAQPGGPAAGGGARPDHGLARLGLAGRTGPGLGAVRQRPGRAPRAPLRGAREREMPSLAAARARRNLRHRARSAVQRLALCGGGQHRAGAGFCAAGAHAARARRRARPGRGRGESRPPPRPLGPGRHARARRRHRRRAAHRQQPRRRDRDRSDCAGETGILGK
jgi:ligand-binding sensor domain-containing protein